MQKRPCGRVMSARDASVKRPCGHVMSARDASAKGASRMQKRKCGYVMSARDASVKRAGQRLAPSLSLPSLLLIFDLQKIA